MIPEYELCDPILRNTHIGNSGIVLQCNRSTGKVSVLGLPTEVKLVLIAMGDEWCRYYLKSYYQDKAF